MSQILFISYTSPFQPKDGLTAALYSLLNNLIEIYTEIDVYVLEESSLYSNFNDKTESISCNKRNNIDLNNYKVVFTSPITSFFKIKKLIPKNRKCILVTQLSDCLVYELWISFILSIKFKSPKIKPLVKLPFHFLSELLVINQSDLILMQTKKDVNILKNIYFTNKAISIPNIPKVESIEINKNISKTIGWCATFKGEYLTLSLWFFKTTLLPFLKLNSEINLHLLGSNNKIFKSILTKKHPELENRIISNDYVLNTSSFFNKHQVIICPIFKGYGLINKTVEALFSGSIVLGDPTAFNGIENLIHGENCLIAKNSKEFLNCTKNVFYYKYIIIVKTQ